MCSQKQLWNISSIGEIFKLLTTFKVCNLFLKVNSKIPFIFKLF